MGTETIDQSAYWKASAEGGEPVPGLLLVFSAGEPLCASLPLDRGDLTLGRGEIQGVQINDGRMSRRHARVSYAGGRFKVDDLGSRNGTAVDGRVLEASASGEARSLVRMGDTLFLACPDLRPFFGARVEANEDHVVGPRLRAIWEAIRRAAEGATLHITGESGAGKELAARGFHEFGPAPRGPFIAVNCATIPEGVAERLLFGARKGAFSGAHADASGYIKEADGGTLFLDEIGELDPQVQAKLLRVVETREVTPLGAARAQKVDLRICSATHRDLRERVREKKFREDLYFRLARPHVAIPPLRDRPEEIPFLIEREVRRVGARLVAHVSLVEACLLRPWPGNVRELLVEAREAARAAAAADEAQVRLQRLAPHAGRDLDEAGARPGSGDAVEPKTAEGSDDGTGASGPPPDRAAIEEALRRCEGRVATAARELGMHRNQLRRWLVREGVDPLSFAPSGKTDPDDGDAPSDE